MSDVIRDPEELAKLKARLDAAQTKERVKEVFEAEFMRFGWKQLGRLFTDRDPATGKKVA